MNTNSREDVFWHFHSSKIINLNASNEVIGEGVSFIGKLKAANDFAVSMIKRWRLHSFVFALRWLRGLRGKGKCVQKASVKTKKAIK